MSTQNRRVATYLPSEIDDHFKRFKSERGIKGDSQALAAILSEFFGVSQEVAQGSSNLLQRVEVLEDKVTLLKDKLLSELRIELLEHRSSSIEQAKAEVKDELLSELKNEPLKSELTSGQLDLLVEVGEPLEEEINELSSGLESKSLESKSLGEEQAPVTRRTPKPPSSDGTLTTGELAKRLGIDSSTLSHWRPGSTKGKSPDELLKATREKDPDGIGWIHLPDVKRFQPERSISSELPEMLKSDSLVNQGEPPI